MVMVLAAKLVPDATGVLDVDDTGIIVILLGVVGAPAVLVSAVVVVEQLPLVA